MGPFAWIAGHPFAYPLLEVLHIVGIAALVGNLLLFELRVWGVGARLPLAPLAQLSLGVAFAGFGLVAASGLLMFASQSAELIANPAFVVKMGLVASSFDQARPIYLEGCATKVAWRNPHAEFDLELAPDLKLPADLKGRALPAQTAPVEGTKLLAAAQLPTRKDRVWHIELAPLTRTQAWNVPPLQNGTELALLGYTFTGEKGNALLRVEYLWLGGKTYAMRSSPA